MGGGVTPPARSAPRYRPQVESLEDRVTPSQAYFNDFEDPAAVGPEWSKAPLSVTPAGSRHFLGEFGADDPTTLSLTNLDTHNQVTVSFDLYVIRSWDGNNTQIDATYGPLGPDVWDPSVAGGPTLLHTTFSNHTPDFYAPSSRQAYPDAAPGGDNAAFTGAAEVNTLGYLHPVMTTVPMDSVYHLSFTFDHSDSALALNFSSRLTQDISDESWGLDNVQVTTQEVPAPPLSDVAGGFTVNAVEVADSGQQVVATFRDPGGAQALPVAVSDPSFATPNVGTGTFYAFAYNPAGGPWTFNSGSGVAGDGSGFTAGNPDPPDGSQVAFLQGTGSSINQALNFAVSGDYRVGFLAAQRGNWQPAGPQTVEVLLDGNLVGSLRPTGADYATYTTTPFAVTAGRHTLTFRGTTDGDSTAFLDQVSVQPAGAADPYPATIDWGDGSTSAGLVTYDAASDTFSVRGSHTYAEEGAYDVVTTIAHGANPAVTAESTANVADAPLSAVAVPVSADSSGVVSGTVAYLVDDNTNATPDDYFVTIDWGDGSQTGGTVRVVTPIVEGSFEAPHVGTGTFYAFAYDPSGSAWTFQNGAGVAGDQSGFTSGNPGAPDGTQVGFLQGAGATISQDVLLPAGTYTLGFLAAQRGNWNQGGQTFQVQVDGNPVGTFTPTNSSYASFTTSAFTVTAGTHTVSFVGLNPFGGDNTAFIDEVALRQTVFAVTGHHAYDHGGTYTVGVEVDDLGGSSVTTGTAASVANVPLMLNSPGDQGNGEGDAVALQLIGRGDAAGPFTYSALNLPGGLTLDPQTGLISGTVDYAAAETSGGLYSVLVSVTDGVSTTSQTFTWMVANVPLTLADPGDQINNPGDNVALVLATSGGESSSYTYDVTGLPSGLGFNPLTGVIFGTVDAAAAQTDGGAYTVTASASDGTSTVSRTFHWNVVNAPIVTVFALPDQVVDTADYLFERTGDLNTSLTVSYTLTVAPADGSSSGDQFSGAVTFSPGESWKAVEIPVNLSDPEGEWYVSVTISADAAGQYVNGRDFVATDVLRPDQHTSDFTDAQASDPNPQKQAPKEMGLYVDNVKVTVDSDLYKKYKNDPVAKEIMDQMINASAPNMVKDADFLDQLIKLRLSTVKAATKANEIGLAFTQQRHADAQNSDFFERETKDFEINNQLLRSPGIKMKDGKKATDAIDDIFKNPKKYSFDCQTMTQVIFHKALRDTFPDNYNDLAKSLSFHSWYVDQNLRALQPVSNRPLRPGDRIAFHNPAAKNPNFKIENSIYLGGGKYFTPALPDPKAEKDGNIHTEARILELLDSLDKEEGNDAKPEKAKEVAYPLIPQQIVK